MELSGQISKEKMVLEVNFLERLNLMKFEDLFYTLLRIRAVKKRKFSRLKRLVRRDGTLKREDSTMMMYLNITKAPFIIIHSIRRSPSLDLTYRLKVVLCL